MRRVISPLIFLNKTDDSTILMSKKNLWTKLHLKGLRRLLIHIQNRATTLDNWDLVMCCSLTIIIDKQLLFFHSKNVTFKTKT